MDETYKPLIPIEEQFKLMADSAPVLIWVAGTDKLCYFMNAGWLRFTGRTLEQEQGNGWAEGVHPDDYDRCLHIYTTAFDARQDFKMEYRLRRYDGVYRWIVDYGVPRYTAQGEFAGYIGSCMDIDEIMESERVNTEYIRKESLQRERDLNDELSSANQELAAANEELASLNEELAATNEELQSTNEELLRSREQLSLFNDELEVRVTLRTAELSKARAEAENERDKLNRFFMRAPAGICVLTGPDLVFDLVNPLYQSLFPGRKILGKPLLQAIPEVKGQPIWDIIQKVYNTGETFEGRELIIPLAKSEESPVEDRYFNFIYQAQFDADGKVSGIIVFVIEVTDMVLARRKIQENAERFQTQLDALPQIAWTNTVSGEVDFYNQKWYDYTGLDFEQTKAWGWKEVIHPDDLAYNLEMYGSILQGTTGGEFEIREKRIDGEYRWHLVRILPIKNDKGEVYHWIGTATDIHDLKLLQSQKDDFISIASHELKTPVTSLKASLQLLDRMKERPSEVMLPKLISQATRSVAKIGDLIEDLLDASRVNESQLHIKKTSFKIADLLNGCCHHVRVAGKHPLIFEGDTDLVVYADEDRIDQVIVNFVNNAVKYAPDSDAIYLKAEKADNGTKVSVRDNGPGIPADKLPHLFSKYYRAEYSGIQYSGLGLGLYISAEIMKRHGGEIGVDSELGKGSTFWITIP